MKTWKSGYLHKHFREKATFTANIFQNPLESTWKHKHIGWISLYLCISCRVYQSGFATALKNVRAHNPTGPALFTYYFFIKQTKDESNFFLFSDRSILNFCHNCSNNLWSICQNPFQTEDISFAMRTWLLREWP